MKVCDTNDGKELSERTSLYELSSSTYGKSLVADVSTRHRRAGRTARKIVRSLRMVEGLAILSADEA